jgi:hypothetical protein
MNGYQQREKIQRTEVDQETLLYVSTDESSKFLLA